MTRRIAGSAGILVLLGALLCVGYGVRGLLAGYYSSWPGVQRFEGVARAAALVPEGWRYRVRLAEIATALGRNDLAATYYEESLRLYPGCGRCWLGLAEARAALRTDATDALAKAVGYGRSETSLRMRAGVLYARLGRSEEAGVEFAAAQRGMIERRRQFYSTLHRIYDVRFLLEHVVGTSDLPAYFAFVRQNRPIADAEVVWQRLAGELPADADGQRKAYAQRLMAEGQVSAAWRIYFDAEAAEQAGIVQGGFEDVTDVRPFGWYIQSAEGISAAVAPCKDCPEGKRALRVAFDGKSNPQFAGIWQDVPVDPGTGYVLRAKVRAEHITSASGPRLAVRGISRPGVDCPVWAATEDWKLSSPWTDVELAFQVPPGCDGVRIHLARQTTTALNKFLGGELWMDDVRLEKAGQAASAGGPANPE